MAVINGRESNLTQIDPNRYLNNVKLAKEAQELAQLLRGLDRQVSVVTEGEKHSDGKCNRMETFFNYKPEPFTGSPLKDGIKYGGIEIKYSQKAFSSDYTANDALALNWASTTGNVGFLIHRYEYNYATSYNKNRKDSHEFDYGNASYGLETIYNVGNDDIFSNPSIIAKAGATVNKYRYVYATSTETSNGENFNDKSESYSMLDKGVQYIEVNAWEFGKYGRGYGIAKVYSDKTSTSSVVGIQKLTVN